MITEKEYADVQRLNGNKKVPYQRRRSVYYPLKMMVVCSYCKNHMYAGASKGGSGNKYLFYRCDNKQCTRKKKSIRGKVIFGFIYDFLKSGLEFTEKEYESYLQLMGSLTTGKQETLQREIHSRQSLLKQQEREIKDIAYKLLDFDKDSTVYGINNEKLSRLESENNELKAAIATLKDQVRDPEKDILTIEQFLNLSKNAGVAIQLGNEVVKDTICRLIFLNLVVDEEKVTSFEARSPFKELLKARIASYSRG